MNVDDPRLTAYALGELSANERVEIEKLLNQSPEARQFVNETRAFAVMMRNEYSRPAAPGSDRPANLTDIRDDPWFWSRARPLAIAALIALVAVLGAILLGPYKGQRNPAAATDQPFEYADVEAEQKVDASTKAGGPNAILNPLRAVTLGRAERVVIGELPPDADSNRAELRIIETITDSGRLSRLTNRLATKDLSKNYNHKSASSSYQLIFLDANGQILAAVSFRFLDGVGFVLQPLPRAYASGGRYFVGNETPVLPGNWDSDVDYAAYIIPFPDWQECIGYSPGV
jgi:hypothetical protein